MSATRCRQVVNIDVTTSYVGYHTTMARIYGKGQIVLPRAARDELGLEVGDELTVTVGDGELILRKAPSIFDHVPPRPRRDVGLDAGETVRVAWDEHVARAFGRSAG